MTNANLSDSGLGNSSFASFINGASPWNDTFLGQGVHVLSLH